MGDAYSDMAKANRAYDSFVESIPDIENMIAHTPFSEMTDEQHMQAHSYYQYKQSELESLLESLARMKYDDKIRRHWDASLHQGEFAKKKK